MDEQRPKLDERNRKLYVAIFKKLQLLPDKLLDAEIRWALDPSEHPKDTTIEDTEVNSILSDYIARALSTDELHRYVTEQHNLYFSRVWGDGAKFRETQKYFSDYSPIHLDDNTTLVLHTDRQYVDQQGGDYFTDTTLTVENCNGFIKDFKNQFGKLSEHVERYKKSLEYQLNVVDKTLGFVKTHVKAAHGKPLTREIVRDPNAGPAPQYEQEIKNFLVDQHALEDPLIGHHMYAACGMAYEATRKEGNIEEIVRSIKFNARNVQAYFKALHKNLETNIAGCNSIMRLCLTNIEQVDRIVAGEKKRAGISKGE